MMKVECVCVCCLRTWLCGCVCTREGRRESDKGKGKPNKRVLIYQDREEIGKFRNIDRKKRDTGDQRRKRPQTRNSSSGTREKKTRLSLATPTGLLIHRSWLSHVDRLSSSLILRCSCRADASLDLRGHHEKRLLHVCCIFGRCFNEWNAWSALNIVWMHVMFCQV